ncbi:hypothetical protein [Nocardioides sp.]|uniref:hypothetical protein n=1 Tax=Nocardioides sp. TaxID=35761 RepID=UPI0025D0AA57|nr:hypothetical protein [Nocardioides sp.]
MKRLLLLVTPVLVIALGTYAWGTREPAVSATHDRAVALFNAMETYAGATAMDRALEATAYPGVELVVARNTEAGHEIVLRITASATRRNNLDWWPDPDAHYEATRCYRWTDDREWDTAEQVTCPEATDIDPTRAAEAGPIGAGVDLRVRRALTGATDAAGVSERLSRVPDLSVEEVDGAIAVAVSRLEGYVSGRPVRDCVLAYRRGDEVRVWRPASIQVAPGEASCEPQAALDPALQKPPH